MNITNEFPVVVFKNNYNGIDYYKIGLSKKDIEGNYVNGYKSVKFKKGVSLEDKTKIYIRKAWLDFYIKDKKTIDYIFISEFETVGETIEKAKEETKVETGSDIFSDFGESVNIDDNWLD